MMGIIVLPSVCKCVLLIEGCACLKCMVVETMCIKHDLPNMAIWVRYGLYLGVSIQDSLHWSHMSPLWTFHYGSQMGPICKCFQSNQAKCTIQYKLIQLYSLCDCIDLYIKLICLIIRILLGIIIIFNPYGSRI